MREAGDILRPLIRIGDSPGACWEWNGKKTPAGYGCKQFGGKTVLAHRWVYQMFNGWLPKDSVLDHLCRNPSCVNPRHLEMVNTAENVRRGRATKLTAEQVAEIKSRLSGSKHGDRKKIAADYGVSPGLISDIRYGRAWSDIR